MPRVASEWNVVINGAWNLSILTPKGIATRLFGLEPGVPVEVQVALDQAATIRVIHDTIRVSPISGRLMVDPVGDVTPERLAQSAQVAIGALRQLPQTPISACGVNIRYQYDELPATLIDVARSVVDDRLADAGHRIVERFVRRTLPYNDGVVNVEVIEKADVSGLVAFNFHRDSVVPDEHIAWLQQVHEMCEQANAHLRLLENQGGE